MDKRAELAEMNRQSILTYLLGQKEPDNYRGIATAMNMDYSTVHRHIDTLVSSGLVEIVMLPKARNGSRMAFKAADAKGIKLLDMTGKWDAPQNVLQGVFLAGKLAFDAVPVEDVRYRKNILEYLPLFKAAAAVADIFRLANRETPPPGFPRIPRTNLEQAIEDLEQQVKVLRAILNCSPLWDRKILKESNEFIVKPQSLKAIDEFLTALDSL